MTLPKPQNLMRGFLAVAVLACLMLSLFWLLQMDVPEANRDIVNMLIGSLATMTGGAMSHYFGTSKSSADKNEIIREANQEPQHVDAAGNPVPVRHARPAPAEMDFEDFEGDET